MKIKKLLIMSMSAVVFCGAISTAIAMPEFNQQTNCRAIPSVMKDCKRAKEHRFIRLKREFAKLSPQQQEAVQQLRATLKQQTKPIRSQLKISKLLLKAELLKVEIDTDKVNNLIDQIGKLQTELMHKRVGFIVKVEKTAGIHLPLHGRFHRYFCGKF